MIQILLSTYNSESYLQEQLDSLYGQVGVQIELLVRDDGSSDGTFGILEENIKKWGERLCFIQDEKCVGVSRSYSLLLEASTAPYVMFCDHDDVWLSTKVLDSLEAMQLAEKQSGPDRPLLVYSDLQVVDDRLHEINSSCYDQQHVNPRKNSLNRILLQNVATGCTIMMNRALVGQVGWVPKEAVMHDHWVALVAACFGELIYLDKPTMLYRQHASNVFGAADYGWRYFINRWKQGVGTVRSRFYRHVIQGEALLNRYESELGQECREMLNAFAEVQSSNWVHRRMQLLRYRIFKHGVRRNAGMFLVI